MAPPPILNRVNADLSKQAQYFFRRKTKNISHPLLHFNNNIVLETPYQKHPCIFDAWLTFEEHLKGKQNYKNFMAIAKNFAENGINNCVQNFCETTSQNLMTFNCLKLGRPFSFMRHLVSLMFLPKTLIWNKIMF